MIKQISLEDCLAYVIDNRGVTPHKRKTEWVDKGIPVLSANNVKTNGLQKINEIRYISDDIYSSWMKKPLEKGDILLTSEAPAGEVMYRDSDEKVIVGQRLYGLKIKKTISSKYLKYYLESQIGQKEIKKHESGSTVFGISAKTFSNIKVTLPDRDIQNKIGEILYSIDTQIKRNNSMVQKLQILARATFDYFSKNNAKSNFVFLNDILVEKDKSKIQVKDVQDTSGFIPFFTSGETILYTNKKLETGFNIFLSTGGNAKVQAYYGDAAYSTDTWCITAKNNLQFYLFGYLKRIESQMDKLYFHGTGLKHLQKPIFLKSIITIPNEDLLIKYNTIIEPIYHQISKIEQSTIQLQYLKNKLLPLLINQQLV